MTKEGRQAQTVTLKHGGRGHWIGNPNAKNVVIYYHGQSPLLFVAPALRVQHG
jgi:hypothetical protein